MLAPDKLKTHSIGDTAMPVLAILGAAFQAIDAGVAASKYLDMHPVPPAERIFALGLGKAACAMTQAAASAMEFTDALVITKHASPLTIWPVTVIEGNHPVPGESSLLAGAAALKFVGQLTKQDLLLCLISGGGSSLMTAPTLPISEMQSLTTALLASGARIDEINILRRHLDVLKGGGLVRHANGVRILSLLLSDVVGDSVESIASGPTAPDPTTRAEALKILKKYEMKGEVSASVEAALYETLKPGEALFEKVQNIVIASNEMALLAAQAAAQVRGFHTTILDKSLQGEASSIGIAIANRFRELLKTTQRPFCLLAGGETTVTLKGNGRGGRNQEFALAAVDTLAGLRDVMLISVATDGEDGPTDAAGAVVSGETAQRAESLGMSASDYLSRNDAYSFFERLCDLIKIGPSGTNVNDLVLCFAF